MEALVKSIENNAKRAIKTNEGDYINEDGLLVCGRCNTPKQGRYEMPFGTVMPYILCKCEKEKHDKKKAERERAEFLEKVKRMRRLGFPDAEMERWTFAVDDHANERVSSIARNYVEHFDKMRKEGKGLLFYGPCGTGKSFTAACIANALVDKGYPCMMTKFSRLTNTLQGMYDGKQKYIDSLNDFSLLVIDDLAAERDTEYMGEIVYDIIDSRYRAGLPLIVTTNLTSQELKNPADIRKQRIYSRLFDMTIPVAVDGADRRKQGLRDSFDEYKQLLGL